MDELGKTLRATTDLLIIDQAEQLKLLLVQHLRFYFFSKWGVSLFFVGRPELEKMLRKDPDIESRISAWHSIEQFEETPVAG